MIILLLLPFLINGFIQKWYIPLGTIAPGGRILVYDSDHDGRIELIFRRWIPESFGVYFAEFVPPDSWDIIESQTVDSVLVWDISDYDNDSISDLIVHGDASGNGAPVPIIAIFESPDSFSYPTQEVWRDTVGQPAVTPISTYDIDHDGFTEIVKVGANGIDFVIYEAIGNNLYARIYEDTIQGINTPLSTIAFGDFDDDGKIEFVLGNLSDGAGGANYWLYESPADNTYEFIHLGSVPTKNIKDCFSVPDADGDGKLEFVVKGFTPLDARTHAFIFEAIGDNTYEIIKSYNLAGGDYYGGYSEAGDVDGDSVPEIVLESASYVYIIKAAGNDSFYVWDTLPGHTSGSSIAVYDIDENGLAEIIISGNNETRIYEYDTGGMEETALRITPDVLRIHISPNPFSTQTKISFGIGHGAMGIELKIYDVSGRMIKQFDYPTLRLSDHIIWHGDDDNGRAVSQGIYFLQVENLDSGETSVHKVLRVR